VVKFPLRALRWEICLEEQKEEITEIFSVV
jgi:hypothetical protein